MNKEQFITTSQERIEYVLESQLAIYQGPSASLNQAISYALLGGGKRLRPCLIYASATTFDIPMAQVDSLAAAVEMIHCYSLIHDDLPAMDNDDWRRGRLTCHKAFDEATAILAGDALQNLAYEVITHDKNLEPTVALQLLQGLTTACGTLGMVGGQALDVAATGKIPTLAQLEEIHRLKTGALIEACVNLPILFSMVSSPYRQLLQQYARLIGVAFQIQDDILNVTGDQKKLGKQTGTDAALGKATYPAVLGLAESKRLLAQQFNEAVGLLQALGARAPWLVALSEFIVDREI